MKQKKLTRREAERLAATFRDAGIESLRLALQADTKSARLASLLCLVVARNGGELRLPSAQLETLPERHVLQERYDEATDEVVLTSALRPEVAADESLNAKIDVVTPKIEVVSR